MSKNKITLAISSALPTLPAGCCKWSAFVSSIWFAFDFFLIPETSIQPGLMQFTLISGPRLTAKAGVSARIPPLLAE